MRTIDSIAVRTGEIPQTLEYPIITKAVESFYLYVFNRFCRKLLKGEVTNEI